MQPFAAPEEDLRSREACRLMSMGRSAEFSAEAQAELEKIIQGYPERQAAILPALWLAQREFGWISREVITEVARLCQVHPAHVYGVVSFYTMFHRAPRGKHHLQLCTNLSCQLRGAEHILECLARELGIAPGERTADGLFSLEEVECLAACELAPVLQVNEDFAGPMTVDELHALIERLRGGGPGVMEVKLLTRNFGTAASWTREAYEAAGGYRVFRQALAMEPEAVTQVVKDSGLRGRGGAGFPTGLKWSFVPKEAKAPKYLCVNADESEPGTFKDRYLLELDPHALIEGIIITCWAVGIHRAYIYIRGEFGLPYHRLRGAIEEAYAKGYLGKSIDGKGYDLEVTVHRGAGAYICGEETGLIESLEGKKGQPRIKPPFPAVVGAFGGPTVVNNVETICAVPWILEHGAAAYRQWGTEKSPGTKLFSISGSVNRPGVYEVPLGFPLKELVHGLAGGIPQGKKMKANIPGGSSVPVLTGQEAEGVLLDYESLAAAGTMLGSGGMIVLDEDTCMVWALAVLEKFYAHESCGQCTPCREGTGWLRDLVYRLEEGGGSPSDMDKILSITRNMIGTTICVLSDAAAMPAASFVTKFRGEFEAHVGAGRCPIRGRTAHFLKARH